MHVDICFNILLTNFLFTVYLLSTAVQHCKRVYINFVAYNCNCNITRLNCIIILLQLIGNSSGTIIVGSGVLDNG